MERTSWIDCAMELPLTGGNPSFRYLSDDDHQDKAEHEPGDDGPGKEFGGRSQAQEPRYQQAESGPYGQRGGEGRGAVRVAGRHWRHNRAGYDRHGGDRANDEVGRRSEDRVSDEGRWDRVDTHDDRDTGDAGVAQRLRHGECRDNESGEQVAAEPAPPIAGCPGHDGQSAPETIRNVHRPITSRSPRSQR